MKASELPLITDEEAGVYSELHFPHNIPLREVCCTICGYRTITNLANPRCGSCHANLINIVRSHFDEK